MAISLKEWSSINTPTNGTETGNREVILADSGRMYTDKDRSYLVFQLFNGNDYQEYSDNNSVTYASNGTPGKGAQFVRNGFKDYYRLVISLESFGLKKTDENQFEYHEYMKNLHELSTLTDSLRKDYKNVRQNVATNSKQYYTYQFKPNPTPAKQPVKDGKWGRFVIEKAGGSPARLCPGRPESGPANAFICYL